MLAELTAAMAAIRETAQLVKIFNDAKTEAEKIAAVGELNSKLASIQRECVSLVELVGSYQEMNASLKAKIEEFENFKADSEGYELNQLPSGSLVYTKKHVVSTGEIAVHVCPRCFLEKKISVLQPCAAATGHFQIFCPSCTTIYRKEQIPSRSPRVARIDPFSEQGW